MTKILDGHKYTEKHEWVKVEGDTATFGISDFAQNALGDIVFVDLPKIGKAVNKDAFGAWMIKVKNINLSEADSLMDSNKYKDFTATL